MSANYPDRFAEAMALEITEAEKEAVLELARVVAHGSERMFAPLSTYLAGQSAAEAGRMRKPDRAAVMRNRDRIMLFTSAGVTWGLAMEPVSAASDAASW